MDAFIASFAKHFICGTQLIQPFDTVFIEIMRCNTCFSGRDPAQAEDISLASEYSGCAEWAQFWRSRQRGASLFIVLVILLLALMIVLGGLIVANLNEMVVGNQSDAQRAYSAAEALLDAAQLDIRLNGRYCNATALGEAGQNYHMQTGLPPHPAACTLRYPGQNNWKNDYIELLRHAGGINSCASKIPFTGICMAGSPAAGHNPLFSAAAINNSATRELAAGAQQWRNGATYAQFIPAALTNSADYGGSAAAGSGPNTISLALTGNTDGPINGKYWVEIYLYKTNNGSLAPSDIPIPDPKGYPFVFRITAMSKGLRGGTISVLRTYYIPYPQQIP